MAHPGFGEQREDELDVIPKSRVSTSRAVAPGAGVSVSGTQRDAHHTISSLPKEGSDFDLMSGMHLTTSESV